MAGPDQAAAWQAPGSSSALHHALERELGEPAQVVVAWVDPPVVPNTPNVRVVYAFASLRLATLRHWRDETEWSMELGGVPRTVVALEASKWARLMLKSHGGTLLACARQPDLDPLGAAASLPAAAHALWDDVADQWCAAAGVAPLAARTAPAPTLSSGPRFARVEGWLREVRTLVDAASGSTARAQPATGSRSAASTDCSTDGARR